MIPSPAMDHALAQIDAHFDIKRARRDLAGADRRLAALRAAKADRTTAPGMAGALQVMLRLDTSEEARDARIGSLIRCRLDQINASTEADPLWRERFRLAASSELRSARIARRAEKDRPSEIDNWTELRRQADAAGIAADHTLARMARAEIGGTT